MTKLFSSVQARLTFLVAGGLGAIMVIAGIAIVKLHEKLSAYDDLLETSVKYELQISDLNYQYKVQVQEWKNVLLRGKDPEKYQKYWSEFSKLQNDIQAKGKKLSEDIPPSEAQTTLKNFLKIHAEAFKKYEEGARVFSNSDFSPSAGDKAVTGIDREPSKLLQTAVELIGNESRLQQDKIRAESLFTQRLSVVVLIVFGALIVAVMIVIVRTSFVRPLSQINSHIEKLAQGDFRNKLFMNQHGEWDDLNNHINKMQDSLSHIFLAMQNSSQLLSAVAIQISNNSNTILQSTETTNQSTDQVAAAVNEMSATVQEVARNASGAATAASEVEESVKRGTQKMNASIQAIQSLSTEVDKVSLTMEQLESETLRIGGVLDVIKNVAEQTNLLALNAAIEAARAGEQGRGFAVVADEVRALAKRTQESTAEIQHIIEAVQKGSVNAVSAMKLSRTQTYETSNMVNQAGESIAAISHSIGQITQMNSHIATAAEEQSYAAEEINRNVVAVANLVEKASGVARDAHSLAHKLEQASQDLNAQVAKFQLH